jgi:predicted permease
MLAGYVKIMDAEAFVPISTKFVFYAALPSLVLKELGINIDFYDESFLWEFIFCFLILRAVGLGMSFCIVAIVNNGGVGQVAVLWLAMTWISTVILGIPIAGAVFDNPTKGAKYGILAGVSSFIFQLPVQLFFLECHLLEEESLVTPGTERAAPKDDKNERDLEIASSQKVVPVEEEAKTATVPTDVPEVALTKGVEQSVATEQAAAEEAPAPNTEKRRILLFLRFLTRRDIWVKILRKVFYNPVLWAIVGGFFLSLSTLGPTYLNDKSEDFVPGLGWISDTLTFLGSTVTPLSLFTMGVWMQQQGKHMFKMNPWYALVCMISKLILVPLIMIGLAKSLNLENEPGRAAVLIAALPISMASFTLANRYGIGEAIMAENIAVGTFLILPVVIVWNLVLDEVDLFPIQ